MHSAVLFFFLLGMAIGIVNADYVTARAFSAATVLQRGAYLSMLLPILVQMPRARDHVMALGSVAAVTLLCFVVPIFQPAWAEAAWAVTAALDWSTEFILSKALPGPKLLPVNIEHSKDRLGVLVLVMLGETVISSTISYREEVSAVDAEEQNQYYTVLVLAFLLIFMFCLIFFNMQPPVQHHAFRRSRLAGCTLLLLNKALGLALLCVGVCIKLAIQEIVEEEYKEEASPVAPLLAVAVGLSLLLLYGMRICHYGGKLPRPTDPPDVQWLMWIWWATFGAFSVAPFLFAGLKSSITALAVHSGLVLALTVVESTFTHVLEGYLPTEEETPLTAGGLTTGTYNTTEQS
jgi:low temperature requirement protein LtrA